MGNQLSLACTHANTHANTHPSWGSTGSEWALEERVLVDMIPSLYSIRSNIRTLCACLEHCFHTKCLTSYLWKCRFPVLSLHPIFILITLFLLLIVVVSQFPVCQYGVCIKANSRKRLLNCIRKQWSSLGHELSHSWKTNNTCMQFLSATKICDPMAVWGALGLSSCCIEF